MTAHRSLWGYFAKALSIVLSVALIAGTLPLAIWSPMYRLSTVKAASRETAPGVAPNATRAVGAQGLAPAVGPGGLGGTGRLTALGRPNGMLVDIAALQVEPPRAAVAVTDPLSISRVQSAYRSADSGSGTLVITFTVTNNLLPLSSPDVSGSATVTDTMAALSTFDYLKDPNVIRNVMVADTLTGHADLISASPTGDQSAAVVAWNLGDIPPLGSVTATLTVQVAGPVSDFADLDTGATAWGTLRGRAVSAQARPATLAPDTIDGEPIGDWLKWTVDADTRDAYMLAKAAELGQDPQRMFEYVRSLGYECYKGSLRRTRAIPLPRAGAGLGGRQMEPEAFV